MSGGVMAHVRPSFFRVLNSVEEMVPGDIQIYFHPLDQKAEMMIDTGIRRPLMLTSDDYDAFCFQLEQIKRVELRQHYFLRVGFIDHEWFDGHCLATWPSYLKPGAERMFRHPGKDQWRLQRFTGHGWEYMDRYNACITDWGVETTLSEDRSIIFLYDVTPGSP